MQSIFKTESGRLTRYALACGYIERRESDYDRADYRSVTLQMDGSRILVKVYQRDGGCVGESRYQYTGDSIKEARKVFAQECRRLELTKEHEVRR